MSNITGKSRKYVMEGYYDHRKHLLGRILTIVDGSTTDEVQRKAIKNMLEGVYYEETSRLICLLSQYFGFLAEVLGETENGPTPKKEQSALRAHNPLTD